MHKSYVSRGLFFFFLLLFLQDFVLLLVVLGIQLKLDLNLQQTACTGLSQSSEGMTQVLPDFFFFFFFFCNPTLQLRPLQVHTELYLNFCHIDISSEGAVQLVAVVVYCLLEATSAVYAFSQTTISQRP